MPSVLSIFSIHHVTRPPTTWRTTGTPRTCWAPPRSGTFSAPSTWRRSSRRGQLELAVRLLTVSPTVSLSKRPSASKSFIRRFVITEKAPSRAFSWLKAATTAFTFKTLLRHYAQRGLTPWFLNVKLGPRRKGHKGRLVWLG